MSSAAVSAPFASKTINADQGVTQLSAAGVFDLGDLRLASGTVLPNAKIGYKTHGTLNVEKNNVILYPTPYPAQHGDIEWLIGPGRALDPAKYFIIVLDQLGNGLSSSPSNTPAPLDRMRFPTITIQDDVTAQHRLVTSQFGIERIALVVGWSMGAQQTFQWAVSHPGMVERIAPFCGTAKTTPHNWVFLQSLYTALTTDPVRGLRAFAHIYASWAPSQPFYKKALYKALGFATLEEYLTGFWETRYARRDANNLLILLRKWQSHDVGNSNAFSGSLERALGSITAKAVVMAGQTDLYFTPEDIEADASQIRGARYVVIPSLWGHMAGSGLNDPDTQFIDTQLKALLAS
jgi:homoserine O-acetyltransferase